MATNLKGVLRQSPHNFKASSKSGRPPEARVSMLMYDTIIRGEIRSQSLQGRVTAMPLCVLYAPHAHANTPVIALAHLKPAYLC